MLKNVAQSDYSISIDETNGLVGVSINKSATWRIRGAAREYYVNPTCDDQAADALNKMLITVFSLASSTKMLLLRGTSRAIDLH